MMSEDNNMITLYLADCRGDKYNTSYPLEYHIESVEDLAHATTYDHVGAKYGDGLDSKGNLVTGYRSKGEFLGADNIIMDCDNKPTRPNLPDTPPELWKTPEDVQKAFPDVPFYAVPSRNHMMMKDGMPARPKFHYYFPLEEVCTDAAALKELKTEVQKCFPAFDDNALDPGHFFYGVEKPEPVFYSGNICIDKYMERIRSENKEMVLPKAGISFSGTIPEGMRNSTMNHLAGILLMKYGLNSEKAEEEFTKVATRCDPPLEPGELKAAWNSAVKFYKEKVETRQDYLAPDQYAEKQTRISYEPEDYTDVGQAKVFCEIYGDVARFTDATDLLAYDGKVWLESKTKIHGMSQDLTENQLKEARRRVEMAQRELNNAVESGVKDRINEAKAGLAKEERYRGYALVRRRSGCVAATIKEAIPRLEISVKQLDADAFLLNTPGGAVNLCTGEIRPNDPEDYCTKITAVAPNYENADVFYKFIDRLTVGDKALERYLQEVAGMCAVGTVKRENLIIAYGEGGNGKSTMFNLLSRVMGDYAGSLSAETLTANCRKNKSPEYAELRGKRIVIASELEEGMRLDTGALKKLCSVDPILAEPKYEKPFSFLPSHTLILYTNHLPKVGTMDKGTWDRVIVVPFRANFRGMTGEVYNYGDCLFETCGGAVLTWMIEGARRLISNNFKITLPKCVCEAINQYKEDNDWLEHFIAECCDVDVSYDERSGNLYSVYKDFCDKTGDYRRSLADFKQALTSAGFQTRKTNKGAIVYGLRLTEDRVNASSCTSW